MATQFPQIGDWYKDMALSQCFEVVAIDEQAATIEVQYMDGGVSEYDFESWRQLPLENAEAPEDAAAGYEMSSEDCHMNDEIMVPADKSNPLSSIEPESFIGFDDF